ncbi:MAG TPA: alpha/beta family hydrolase [Usitatibacter sp.]|nr:alpha/beta family hydrolase [Usitatibacter sp.]
MEPREVRIAAGGAELNGTLAPAGDDTALVLFAHGSGSSRHSPRNRSVAEAIRQAGIGTLLFDLLTAEEEQVDRVTAQLRFDVKLLADRLEAATEWAVAQRAGEAGVAIGYFGASTGAAAALIAASRLRDRVGAVVSRGGRPDLAGAALARVTAPTLLIVGERDPEVMVLNEQALSKLTCAKDIARVPRATHLFEEAGTLEAVAALATQWFRRHLLGSQR